MPMSKKKIWQQKFKNPKDKRTVILIHETENKFRNHKGN